MKIGMIGCGNMGFALLSGILAKNLAKPEEIFVFDVDSVKLENTAVKFGVRKTAINEMSKQCSLIIIAVKPQDMELLLNDNRMDLDSAGKIIVSIAAGVSVSLIGKYLTRALIARVMPNTPAMIGKGASGIFFYGNFSDEQKSVVLNIFDSVGTVEVVKKEEWLDAVTGLSGSGPAYVFTFINSLVDAGVMQGLPRDTARKLAVQTVLGSAELAAASLAEGIHPEELKDRVTSPGGTTAAGLFALEEGNFRATVMKAVKDASIRSKELSKLMTEKSLK